MKIAAIDLGSNSFLMLIAEILDGKISEVLLDEVEITRLAQEVSQTGRLHPEALQRAEECFVEFRSLMDRVGVDKVVAVATSAARDAENGKELIDLGKKYGIPIHIVSGKKEARLSYLGATYALSEEADVTIIDIGGGSTEFLSLSDRHQILATSLDIGCVRLFEKFWQKDPISSDLVEQMRASIREEFRKHFHENVALKKMLAIAGTPVTLACLEQGIEFSEEKVEGFKLESATVSKWSTSLVSMSLEERQELDGMPVKRADVIGVGAIILEESMKFFKLNSVEVTTRGVRHGVALLHDEF